MTAHGFRVPVIGRLEADDMPGPPPSLIRVGEILVDDLPRGPTNYTSAVVLPLCLRILGCVIRAPLVYKIDRGIELDAQFVTGSGPTIRHERFPRRGSERWGR